MNLYPCPCCGYKTLDQKPPGTYIICPICFWEDDDELLYPLSNLVSLRHAQRNFINFGACEELWINDVRSPQVDELREPDWQTIDDLAEKARLCLMEKINNAFKDVTLEEGVSLHQARAIDYYDDPQKARQIDSHIPWQEIPDAWIERFHNVFYFMDAKGIRFAIPAYMIWCLKDMNYAVGTDSWDRLISFLKYLKRPAEYNKYFEYLTALTEVQKQVIFEFLGFMDTFTDPGY
uniref:Cysteine-rich CPCC domain-containing protein n=1 Tax=Cyanothece sp. (strain PCC 7425 / ATCC 29141) TaxID=395961 RepID=B8HL10_CYAP4